MRMLKMKRLLVFSVLGPCCNHSRAGWFFLHSVEYLSVFLQSFACLLVFFRFVDCGLRPSVVSFFTVLTWLFRHRRRFASNQCLQLGAVQVKGGTKGKDVKSKDGMGKGELVQTEKEKEDAKKLAEKNKDGKVTPRAIAETDSVT